MSFINPKKNLFINIPTPRVEFINTLTAGDQGQPDKVPSLLLYWEGSDTKFLDYNPRFWLERYKKIKRKKLSDGSYIVKGTRWVHPTHGDGSSYANSKYYSGQQTRNVNTEWATSPNIYDRTSIDLTPLDWVKFSSSFTKVSDISTGLQYKGNAHWNETGYSVNEKRSRLRFRFRIAIDNPNYDPNDPSLSGNDPVLKGDACQEIFFVPVFANGVLYNWRGGFGQQYS